MPYAIVFGYRSVFSPVSEPCKPYSHVLRMERATSVRCHDSRVCVCVCVVDA